MRRTALAPFALLAALACAGPVDLVVAPEAEPAPGRGEAALAHADGVRLVTRAGAWVGEPGVRQHVTPIHVALLNDGAVPLRIRYDQFALVAENGRRYSALPPFEIEGRIRVPRPAGSFSATGFHVAPHHHRFFPHLGVATGFPHDPFWYDHYYDRWEAVSLPTAEMLLLALPEGMLDPGGSLEGYLYFERLEPGHEGVVFRADLVSAAGDSFAELRIPYRAEG